MIDEKEINFIKSFTEVQSFIDHLRIWKYKCYISIDTKFLFDDSKTDKLINKNKSCLFFDYNENIIIQYRIWTSNRRKVIKHHKVTFSKNEKWRNDSLNLSTITFNILLNKQLVSKSRKITQKTFTIIINVIINSFFNEDI